MNNTIPIVFDLSLTYAAHSTLPTGVTGTCAAEGVAGVSPTTPLLTPRKTPRWLVPPNSTPVNCSHRAKEI